MITQKHGWDVREKLEEKRREIANDKTNVSLNLKVESMKPIKEGVRWFKRFPDASF